MQGSASPLFPGSWSQLCSHTLSRATERCSGPALEATVSETTWACLRGASHLAGTVRLRGAQTPHYLSMKSLWVELLGGTEGGPSDCSRRSVSGIPHQQRFPSHTLPSAHKDPRDPALCSPLSGMSWPTCICLGPLWPSPATLWSLEPTPRSLCSQPQLSQLWLCALRRALHLSGSCFLPG